MRFHWQNLNDKKTGGQGFFLKHFRFWWWRLAVEWCCPGRWGLSFGRNCHSDSGLSFSWGAGLFSLYVTLATKYNGKPGRQFDLSFHDKALWLALWEDPMEWRSRDPWWKKIHSIHFDDLLLGRVKYSKEVLRTADITIPMPEGNYAGKAEVQRCTWKRPRWFAHVRIDTWVDVPKGIPRMGKGENSWDCGEDGIFGYGCEGDNMATVAAKGTQLALEERKKYGTPDRITQATAARKE
jgi:hypothetical protein